MKLRIYHAERTVRNFLPIEAGSTCHIDRWNEQLKKSSRITLPSEKGVARKEPAMTSIHESIF